MFVNCFNKTVPVSKGRKKFERILGVCKIEFFSIKVLYTLDIETLSRNRQIPRGT